MINVFRVLLKMLIHLTRRGHGIFKFLFVIDNFFRIFTMTLLLGFLFQYLHSNKLVIVLGVLLGLVIDIHDFVAEMGIAKIQD